MKRTSFDEDFFEIPNLVNSYWAGFIAADGNISKDNKNCNIQISDKDYEHLMKLIKSIKFTGKVSRYTRKNGVSMCNVHFGSKKMVFDLKENFNITPQKTFTLQPPENLTQEQEKAYLIGFIDGDGCINKRKKWNYLKVAVVANRFMVEWIREKFNTILDGSHFIENGISKKNNAFQISVEGRYPGRKILDSLNEIEVPKLQRKWGIVND